MKHEMTAREYVRTAKRICQASYSCNTNCPLYNECGSDLTERGIKIAEKWLEHHPEHAPRKTVLVPDEIVNELTFEATYVDKRGVELSPEAKEMRMGFYTDLVREALPNADSVRCVRLQQFVTKAHEEDAE